jgi:hypothetical protein
VIHRITVAGLSALTSAMKHPHQSRRSCGSSPHACARAQRVDICDEAFALNPLLRRSIASSQHASDPLTSAIAHLCRKRCLVSHRLTCAVPTTLTSAMKHPSWARRSCGSSPHICARAQRVDICDAAFALNPSLRRSFASPQHAADTLTSAMRIRINNAAS